MIKHTEIIHTKTLDPWWNLAVEEYLLYNLEKDKCVLYLWQNQNTVVIGRNQNAWRECRTKLLEEEGGRLARRLSGGGAVFHDTGNLNFTFLVNRGDYNLEKQVGVILSAVKKVGIAAEMTGRNDMTVDGKKFSGNAFCFRKFNAYHHGTILVSADIGKLTRYLQVSTEKIRSKGIESVQSRVTNLAEYNPDLTIEEISAALTPSFASAFTFSMPDTARNALPITGFILSISDLSILLRI
jgi:lipoate-protein ligase A